MNPYAQGPMALVGSIIGQYRLVKIIGQGATGAVYLGEHTETREFVALKLLLLPWQLDDAERSAFRERFRREAQILLALHHPHILSILAYGEEEGIPFLVLPYLSGGTVKDRIQTRSDPLDLAVIARDLEQIAAALDHAHRRKIVHRDIKSSNILYDHAQQMYLADFSIARYQDPSLSQITTEGIALGTPVYMAPEVVLGKGATIASDIYSLGIVLYEMMTGELPFSSAVMADLYAQIVHDLPASPHTLRADVPPATAAVVLRALAKDPKDRFPSAAQLA